jgi:hypothetical protein
MVNTRNSLLTKSVNIINDDIEIKNKIDNEAKLKIENILTEINQQEQIIKELFEKQLNLLRTEAKKFTQKKNIKIYNNN